MKVEASRRISAEPGRRGQVFEWVHSISSTGGRDPRSRGTLRMNQLACSAPERQK